ncbi:hypothetical protein JXA32_11450 [Candidatus Sumerlaeota bacterium]|nr:hypothetical protein [Candidatus Sumerlaeota bacterium]
MLVTIITSAAVGALISGIINLVGQWRERRARRRELLLAKSIDLAFARREFVLKIAKEMGQDVRFKDDISIAAGYFRALEHLMDHSSLPEEALEAERRSLEELDADRRNS